MLRKEMVPIINVIHEMYDVELTELTMEVWFTALKEFDAADVKAAVFKYIRTGKYKPKPADIIELIVNSKVPAMPEEMSAQEAWSLVYKAICNSAYNSLEEFEKLPKMAQMAVGSADNLRSQAIDSEFNLGVAQSNFIKAYNTLILRKNNEYQMRIEAVKRGELSVEQILPVIEEQPQEKLLEINIK